MKAIDQGASDALLLDEEGPPRRFGRMGSEYRLDQHDIEHFLQLFGRHALGGEMLQYGHEAARLG